MTQPSALTPIWIDCDVGHDDAFAILFAAYHQSLNLLGISSVFGNSTIENTTANAMRVLEVGGIPHIKVHKGASKPLLKPPHYAPNIHGKSGLDGTELLPPPNPDRYLDPGSNAVNAMRNAIMSSSEPIAIAATGPLTNIALLVSVYPEVIPRIKTLSIMGGAIKLGNSSPTSEFNIWCDPEAAHIVLNSGIEHIALVPLDVTHTVLASSQVIQRIKRSVSCQRFGQLIDDLLSFFSGTYKDVFGESSGAPLHDPVAVAYLVMRDAFDERRVHVDIVCDGLCVGQTVCDVDGVMGLASNCWVAMEVDSARFWDQMVAALCRASEDSPLRDPLN